MSNYPQEIDEPFAARALELARQGIGLTSPNPCVGAVIVDKDGEVVGEGFHTYSGIKHAEVLALEQAGAKAERATLYINLEPCSHQGRTGPCADAIIAAGIGRVVASMQDPNPVVSGKGFDHLRTAGIAVEIGILQDEARQLNEAFAKFIRHRSPFVTLKSAMTLDGKIALTPKSDPDRKTTREWITGEASRTYVHQLRHQSDAILVGVGTVIADDPLLTDRSGMPRRRPLLRVILDSHLRLPLNSQLVQTANDDVLAICSSAEEKRKEELQRQGVRVELISILTSDRHPSLASVMQRLGEIDITSVLIEGGSRINGAALSEGIVDKVFLFYAPQIFGSYNAVPFAMLPESLDFMPLKSVRLHRFGKDFAVEGYLNDPYQR
jgi:diaminohydroxyphosphoribosylaminopyrimidine deaminase / 5-amino-6-(5-phosphoribosylamino)uracil reductase